jgi:hypothetical protein
MRITDALRTRVPEMVSIGRVEDFSATGSWKNDRWAYQAVVEGKPIPETSTYFIHGFAGGSTQPPVAKE